MDNLKKLLLLYRVSVYAQLSYRVNILIEMVVWLLYAALPLLAVNLFLSEITNLSDELIHLTNLMYGCIFVSNNAARMVGRGFDNYQQLLADGELDIFFIRPLPIIYQVLGSQLFMRRLSGIFMGIIALIRSFCLYGYVSIGVLVSVILCLFLMYLGLMMIAASIIAMTTKGTRATELLVGTSTDIGFYPTDIITSPAHEIFTFIIPIYTCAYLPLHNLIYQGHSSVTSLLIAGCVAGAVGGLGVWLFNRSLARYESSQG